MMYNLNAVIVAGDCHLSSRKKKVGIKPVYSCIFIFLTRAKLLHCYRTARGYNTNTSKLQTTPKTKYYNNTLALYSLSTKTKQRTKMKGRLFLYVVVRQSTPVLKLLASKNESLLIGRNSFLVLDLGLNVVNRVRRLDLKSNVFPVRVDSF
jgi:hypothetical protein